MNLRRAFYIGLGVLLALLLALAALWLARARLVAAYAERYFRQHGVGAAVEIGALGLSGASGRFSLGPADAPELAAERIELFFDPLRWTPTLVEVRLVNPVLRARVDEQGRVTLPSLQAWLDSLQAGKEKSPYVSDDLKIAFTGLRALLATPAGAVEIDGDAKIVRNRPVALTLSVRPGQFGWRGYTVRLDKAALALSQAGMLTVQAAGDLRAAAIAAERVRLDLRLEHPVIGENGAVAAGASQADIFIGALRGFDAAADDLRVQVAAPGLRFSGTVMEASRLTARAGARALAATARFSDLAVTLDARDLRASALDVTGAADMTLAATAVLPPELVRGIRALPVLEMEPPLAAAVGRNLGPMRITMKAQGARRDGTMTARLTAPLAVRASGGSVLQVEALSLSGMAGALTGQLRASLAGGGLPPLRLASQRFTWNSQGLRGDAALEGHFDFAALRGVRTALKGEAAYGADGFRFTLGACANASVAALQPLARDIKGSLCPSRAAFLLLGDNGWRLDFEARDAAGFLPPANAQLSGVAARLSFTGAGTGSGRFQGAVSVTAARLSDKAAPLRFHPQTANGEIVLTNNEWRGRLDVRSESGLPLGAVTLVHAMASGRGSVHVEAPLVFAQGKLQPEQLSPLLASLKQAEGRADFRGDIGWNSSGLAAQTGTLALRDFSFLTPLGTAHGIDTTLNLVSLLPPATAPGQVLKIDRIDWSLPLSGVEMRFGFSTTALSVDALQTGFSEGRIALAPFSLNPSAPGAVSSTATLTDISLEPLIAASNLSGKAALEGKLSGTIPFTAGPAGFRITNGKLAADGPGRLSLGRSLWGDTQVTNVVQDFAFQALENLAFESLTADLNSVDRGRLQILFHIKGRSDPPRPQVADVPVKDIVDGTALQKPLPLPSGTPIDLTLDTSLNFDELLKSYGEAWSKTLAGLGAK